MEPLRFKRSEHEKIMRANAWQSVVDEIERGTRYRAAVAAARPTLDEIINAKRTPRRRHTEESFMVPDNKDLEFTKEYKTAREIAEEEAWKKVQDEKCKRKKKVKRSLIRKMPERQLTEYEKWAADPRLYYREQKKKEELKKKKLKKESRERKKLLNTNFLQEEDFNYLVPIRKYLTPAYHLRLARKAERSLKKMEKKIMKRLTSNEDPTTFCSETWTYRIRLGLLGLGILGKDMKKKKTRLQSKKKLNSKKKKRNSVVKPDRFGAIDDTLDCPSTSKTLKPRMISTQLNPKNKANTEAMLCEEFKKKSKKNKGRCANKGKSKKKGTELNQRSFIHENIKKCKGCPCKNSAHCTAEREKSNKRKSKTPKNIPRALMTQRQYDNFLAQPRQLPQPPKEKRKKKRNPLYALCSRRIEELALPNKRLARETLNQYKCTLPMESVACLEKILEEPHRERPLTIEEAKKAFKLQEKLERKKDKQRFKKAMKPFETWLNGELELLTDAIAMVLLKSSPREFNTARMQISTKFFRVMREEYHWKIKKPNRNSKRVDNKLLWNAVDVIAAWVDHTYTLGKSMIKPPWRLGKKKHRKGLRVRLVPSFMSRDSSASSSYPSNWVSKFSERTRPDSLITQITLQESLIETIIRILKDGPVADLDSMIHKRILLANTYKDLLALLKQMSEDNTALKPKLAPADEIDQELEDAFLEWALSHRKDTIGLYEQYAIREFSRYLLDMFIFTIQRDSTDVSDDDRVTELERKPGSILKTPGDEKRDSLQSGGKKSTSINPVPSYSQPHALDFSDSAEGESQIFSKARPDSIDSRQSLKSSDSRPLSTIKNVSRVDVGPEDSDTEQQIALETDLLYSMLQKLRDEQGFEDEDYGLEAVESRLDSAGEGGALAYRTSVADEEDEFSLLDEGEEMDLDEEMDLGEESYLDDDQLALINTWGEDLPEDYEQLGEEESIGYEQYEPVKLHETSSAEHPSSIHEHADNTVCCVVVRKYAEWIHVQAGYSQKWSVVYQKYLAVLREFEKHKIRTGGDKADQTLIAEYEKRINEIIKLLENYHQITSSPGDTTQQLLQGKDVICCSKCLPENRLPETDDEPEHEQIRVLADSMKRMESWSRMLAMIEDPDDLLNELTLYFKEIGAKDKRRPKGKKPKKKVRVLEQIKEEESFTSTFEITELPTKVSSETLVVNIDEL